MKYNKLQEEALKSTIQQDFFKDYKYTQLGNIDFVIAKSIVDDQGFTFFDDLDTNKLISILWAEAKRGTNHDIYESFVQLILTIGKEQTFAKYHPPKYIGAFDADKFAFIEYNNIQHVFFQNDFNWSVTPSNHDTKEFKQLYTLCKNLLEENTILFHYNENARDLQKFIRMNFNKEKGTTETISVTKNNFTFVFQRWLKVVKPTIDIDWTKANKANILEADFFLADLLSSENKSLKDKLYVVLKNTKYELGKKVDEMGLVSKREVTFNDKQKAYKAFWSIYTRPPKEIYWDYIIGRRDLLVTPDIREREGSFFTPQIWVEKSQQYLTEVLGENWQDEYYIWDNCGGTGNLENGLANKRNIWVSTLEEADVNIMKELTTKGLNLFENHIFKFDFLNDDFIPLSKGGKMPDELFEIIHDPEKRKKLVIYINPPYVEGDNRKGVGRKGTTEHKTKETYGTFMGYAKRELYVHFMARIYNEISDCVLGMFSPLTHLTGSKFNVIRDNFKAKLEKIFIVPSYTFDNVGGCFPIGFQIWNLNNKKECFTTINATSFNKDGVPLPDKTIFAYKNVKYINDWAKDIIDDAAEVKSSGRSIGNITGVANDFQHHDTVCIEQPYKPWNHQFQWQISQKNLIPCCIYFAVRKCIKHTWVIHNDQFLYPQENWKYDSDFQLNCLVYTLFNGKIFISYVGQNLNHWIPFTEDQVGCNKSFASNFMSEYIADFKAGKVTIIPQRQELLPTEKIESNPIEFSPEAQAVYDAGLELWKYYHSQSRTNPNASFYDIRMYFQGSKNGKMNTKSSDEKYTEFIKDLRNKLKILASKIAPKVYEYGFLKS